MVSDHAKSFKTPYRRSNINDHQGIVMLLVEILVMHYQPLPT